MKKFLLFIFLFTFLQFQPVSANWGIDTVVNQGDVKSALNVDEVNKYSGSGPGSYISARVGIIIGSLLSFIGVLFMILIIYGGLLWMTARGNEQQVEKAKKLIIQSIIGLIIVLSAYAITNLIGQIFARESEQVTTGEVVEGE